MTYFPTALKGKLIQYAHGDGALAIRKLLLAAYNEASASELGVPPQEVRPAHKQPLGERLGFLRFGINEPSVLAAAKKQMGPDFSAPAAPHGVIMNHLLTEAKRVLHDQHGVPKQDVQARTVAGKNHQGWFLGADGGAREFDVGSAQWRIPDWLSAPVEDALTTLADRLTVVGKEELGDGVVAVVRPETFGLEAGTIDHVQMRAVVRDRRGVIVRLFKGIVMIHPDAHDVIAWHDGYGDDRAPAPLDLLSLFPMTWGGGSNFRSRYTLQGAWYQGTPRWARRFFGMANLKLAAGEEHDRDIDRLMKANARIRSLAGYGYIELAARMMQPAAYAGLSRMALPAKAFRFITGLEHIAAIEDELASGDKAYGVPYYFCPKGELHRYRGFKDADGKIRRTLNRRPDLSTGQCTRSHELLGDNPFNAIVVPSWSMLLSGLDFDGDAIVDMPHASQGGLYVAFNELPAEEREERLRHATANRKDAVKEPYGSTLERWAGQLEAKIILGAADLAARRFLDAGERIAAWSMGSWIQAAVDRQKRPVAWPNPAGPREMPKPPSKIGKMRLRYLTDVLRDIDKSEDASPDASDYDKALQNLQTRRAALRSGASLAGDDWQGLQWFVWSDADLAESALRWCVETDWRLEKAQGEIATRRDYVTGEPKMVPFEGRYPKRAADGLEDPSPCLKPLLATVQLLDPWWDQLLRAFDQRDTRTGAFAVKDGLLDALRDITQATGSSEIREQVAGQVTDYNLFRELATPSQLEAYFAALEAPELRLSDVTCLNSSELWEKAKANGELRVRNLEDLWVGFERFPAGAITLVRPSDQPGIHIELHGATEYAAEFGTVVSTNCRTVSDALLELRAVRSAHLPSVGSMVRRADRELYGAPQQTPQASTVKTEPATKPSEGFQVKGEDLFQASLSAA